MADLQEIAEHLASFEPVKRADGTRTVTVSMSPDVRDRIAAALRAAPAEIGVRDGSYLWPKTADIVLPRDPDGRRPDPIAFILGLAAEPWRIVGLGPLLRESGELFVPSKAEAETAAALHWLIGLAIEHGDAWGDVFDRELTRLKAAAGKDGQASDVNKDPHHG